MSPDIDKYKWWKNVLIPLRLLITIPSILLLTLFYVYGWVEYFGTIGSVLIIGIFFGSLFLIAEHLIKKKVERELEKIKRKDDEWLDNYMDSNHR